MSTGKLKQLLDEFARMIDLPESAIDDENYYNLVVDGVHTLELKLNPESNILDFFMQLGLIDPERKEEVIEEMLDANVLWRGTGGLTLGQDSFSGLVTLAYQENIDSMTYQRFQNILETIINNAAYWASRIAGGEAKSTDVTAERSGGRFQDGWVRG